MDRLIYVREQEIRIDFQIACKCQAAIHLKNAMETMPVAFKVQSTNPERFSVKPRNGILRPGGQFVLHVTLRPQFAVPENFPLSEDKFLVKSVVAPIRSPHAEVSTKFVGDLFTNRTGRVYVDAELSVVYVGDFLLRNLVAKGDITSVKHILQRQDWCDDGSDETGKTVLHIAAASGNVEMVKVLLEAGAKVHAASKNGQTAFLEAAYAGKLEVMKVLLDHGADMEARNIRGLAAIHLTSMLNHCDVLQFLIESGANIESRDSNGRTALHCAITEDHTRPVKILLKAGAEKDACSFDGRSALYRAASKGNLASVRLLMSVDANPRARSNAGKSPLDVAIEKGHVEVTEALRAEEGDLLKAARRGDLKRVAASLQSGADVNVRDEWGCTGLHCAALKGHVDVVAELLEHGADVRGADREGHGPLHCAVGAGHEQVVQLLLSRGADIYAENNKGITALQMAQALKHGSIAAALLKAMDGKDSPTPSLLSTSNPSPLSSATAQTGASASSSSSSNSSSSSYEDTPPRSNWATLTPPFSSSSMVVIKGRATAYASGPILTTAVRSPSQSMQFLSRAKARSQASSPWEAHAQVPPTLKSRKATKTLSLCERLMSGKKLIDFLQEGP